VVAKVDFAIIGADFLKHFGLEVDLLARRLLDAITLDQFPAAAATLLCLLLHMLMASTQLSSLLRLSSEVCSASFRMWPTILV
jgi:hypothetical protein